MPFAPRLSATLRVLTAGLSLLLFAALLPAAPASAAAKPKGIAVPKALSRPARRVPPSSGSASFPSGIVARDVPSGSRSPKCSP